MAETAAKTTKPRKARPSRQAPRRRATPATRARRDALDPRRGQVALQRRARGSPRRRRAARRRSQGARRCLSATSSTERERRLGRRGQDQGRRALPREGKSKASEALDRPQPRGERERPDDRREPRRRSTATTPAPLRASCRRPRTALDQKSVEELGEDAREFVRKSPAAAVGLAALAGFLLARLLRR